MRTGQWFTIDYRWPVTSTTSSWPPWTSSSGLGWSSKDGNVTCTCAPGQKIARASAIIGVSFGDIRIPGSPCPPATVWWVLLLPPLPFISLSSFFPPSLSLTFPTDRLDRRISRFFSTNSSIGYIICWKFNKGRDGNSRWTKNYLVSGMRQWKISPVAADKSYGSSTWIFISTQIRRFVVVRLLYRLLFFFSFVWVLNIIHDWQWEIFNK